MSATAQHVPTSGFQGVPQAGPAPAPAVPDAAPQGGFNVPPMGAPARLPAGAGVPTHQVGMQPGWVQNPGQAAQQQVQQVPPVQQTQAQPTQIDVAALVQAALASQQPAPTQAPAPTPTVEATRPEWMAKSANEFDVSTIENPTIRAMASVLQSTGKDLDLDRVLGNALARGDVALVDVAYLSEKGGANAAQLIQIAQGIVTAVNAESDRITSEVHAMVGGEANWSAAVSAFNTTAPIELRQVVAQMLNSTNQQQIKAGAKLVSEFGKQSGLIPQQGAALLQGAAGGGVSAQALTAAAFKAELQKLNPNSASYMQEREALFSRRQHGKRIGM